MIKSKDCKNCNYGEQNSKCGHSDEFNYKTLKKHFLELSNSERRNLNETQIIATSCAYYVIKSSD